MSRQMTWRARVRHGLLWLGASTLCACAAGPQGQGASGPTTQQAEALQRQIRSFANPETPAARQAAQMVDRPWLAGPAQPIAREAVLPPALRGEIDTTLLFTPARGSLTLLGERIYQATGIPVRIMPEALLPMTAFLPRLATDIPLSEAQELAPFLPPGPLPLPQVLDALAHRLHLSWRYEDGAIVFYRTETRVFDVRLLTLDASVDVRLGRGEPRAEGGFSSTADTRLYAAGEDAMAALAARLTPMLTRAGVLAATPGNGASIVVTDTPAALARVARFLAQENRALSRRVRLLIEEVTVELHQDQHLALDWNLLLAAGQARVQARLAGAANAPGTHSRWQAQRNAGVFQNSTVILDALAQAGEVVRHTRVPVYTLNRRPVTHAVRRTFSYIDQVQTQAASTASLVASAPAVSVSQKEATVGVFLTLLPEAQPDGRILLSVAYDNSVALPVRPVTVGQGAQQTQLQQITIDGSGAVQQVALEPGEVVVIAGFERDEQRSASQRLAPGWPLLGGGGDQRGQQRRTTLLLVSAQQEEG